IGSRNSQVLVSTVSAWEIATKVRLGRLDVAADLARDFGGYLAQERFECLSISTEHGIRAGSLPGSHKDPFDRMLVAQAQIESLVIISNDALLDGYGVTRAWQLHSCWNRSLPNSFQSLRILSLSTAYVDQLGTSPIVY